MRQYGVLFMVVAVGAAAVLVVGSLAGATVTSESDPDHGDCGNVDGYKFLDPPLN